MNGLTLVRLSGYALAVVTTVLVKDLTGSFWISVAVGLAIALGVFWIALKLGEAA